ncbi:hypothetical protein D3C83_299550 [compost metagenome]
MHHLAPPASGGLVGGVARVDAIVAYTFMTLREPKVNSDQPTLRQAVLYNPSLPPFSPP